MVVACAPAQPDGYCDESSDCAEHHVCDTFSRQCRIGIGVRSDDAEAWGEFLCFEGVQPSGLGYFTMALRADVARRLGSNLASDTVISQTIGKCRTYELQGIRVINYPGWTANLDDPQSLDLSLFMSPGNAQDGGTQSGGPGPYPLLAFQAGTEIRLGMARGEVMITERAGDYLRGEFVARGAQ